MKRGKKKQKLCEDPVQGIVCFDEKDTEGH